MARELRTEMVTDADPSTVWDVMTDRDGMGEWNPFIREMEGELRDGGRPRVLLSPPRGRPMTVRPKGLEVRPGRRLRWSGHLDVPGLFDGGHVFEIVPGGNGTAGFVHRERFKGLPVPVFWKALDTDTRAGFEAMNGALKDRAESASRGGPGPMSDAYHRDRTVK